MKLLGRCAIVTGAGRGIGKEIAVAYAREGADICLLARTLDQLETAADQIRALGRTALPLVCDVTQLDQVEASVAEAAAQLGRIDVLVNNAGGGIERKRIGEDDARNWQRTIQVNLLGTYFCIRAVLPHMKQHGGGVILNVGSGMGHQARAGNSSYHAAKASTWMLTRCLAMEVWRDNILVNELIPGPVYTELTTEILQPDSPHPSIESEWVKQPEDVTPLAIFLAAQSRHGPTGQSFSLARRPI